MVECVPNFSEGSDPRRVEAIVAAMRVEGVHLLDWSMDADQNRTIVTWRESRRRWWKRPSGGPGRRRN